MPLVSRIADIICEARMQNVPCSHLIGGAVDATIRCGGIRAEPCEPVVQPVCHGDDVRSGWSYEQDPFVAARHGAFHERYHLTAMAVYRSVHGESDWLGAANRVSISVSSRCLVF